MVAQTDHLLFLKDQIRALNKEFHAYNRAVNEYCKDMKQIS